MLAAAKYDGKKSDIWSCGVCLYCMTECRFPFVCAGNDGVGQHNQHTTTVRRDHRAHRVGGDHGLARRAAIGCGESRLPWPSRGFGRRKNSLNYHLIYL